MEAQDKLEKKVGTKEPERLKPAKVKIVEVGLEEVKFGSRVNEKVNLTVKHPDKDETIIISKAKVLSKDKVKTSGLWYNLDDDEKIQKGTTLAEILAFAKVETPAQLKDKDFDTVLDDDGFLVLKAY